MLITNYNNYRTFLRNYIKSRPKKGWGLSGQIAQLIDISAVQFSQVMSGKRDLTPDQAFKLASFLNFTDSETEYLLSLVDLERASHYSLKKFYSKKIERLKKDSLSISKQLPADTQLTEMQQAVFYSSWIYSAIRLFCSIDGGQTLEAICKRFQMERQSILEKLDFLVKCGLCEHDGNMYLMGIKRTLLENSSPFLKRSHINWRWKALQRSEILSNRELIVTSPISLSQNDFDLIRNELVEVLKKISLRVRDSDPEEIACLNIDLFLIDPA